MTSTLDDTLTTAANAAVSGDSKLLRDHAAAIAVVTGLDADEVAASITAASTSNAALLELLMDYEALEELAGLAPRPGAHSAPAVEAEPDTLAPPASPSPSSLHGLFP